MIRFLAAIVLSMQNAPKIISRVIGTQSQSYDQQLLNENKGISLRRLRSKPKVSEGYLEFVNGPPVIAKIQPWDYQSRRLYASDVTEAINRRSHKWKPKRLSIGRDKTKPIPDMEDIILNF